MPPPVSKEPTAGDLKTVRDLLEKAGSERELQRWIKLALPPRRLGRPPRSTPYADDEDALLMAQALHLIGGISLHKAIKIVASWGPLGWKAGRGPNSDAMVKRLVAKAAAENKESVEPPTEAEWEGIQQFVANLDRMDPHPAIFALKRVLDQLLRLKPNDLIGEDFGS
jgi:hypothetical protein